MVQDREERKGVGTIEKREKEKFKKKYNEKVYGRIEAEENKRVLVLLQVQFVTILM